MSDKVIFLDIDGPMIPSSMFLIDRMASYDRKFPAITVAVLNALCERTGGKIVFNTTHNSSWEGAPDIDVALVAAGLNADHLHPSDRKTDYPKTSREQAVTAWLSRHPEVANWIALDDIRFSKRKNVIWVDPDTGLTLAHINRAVKILGGKPILVLM